MIKVDLHMHSLEDPYDVLEHNAFDLVEMLEAAGYRFRSKIGRFETDGVVVHEVHLPGPDGVNLVFLEQEGSGWAPTSTVPSRSM